MTNDVRLVSEPTRFSWDVATFRMVNAGAGLQERRREVRTARFGRTQWNILLVLCEREKTTIMSDT